MNKAIFGGSLASVIFLIIGTFAFPGSPVMWLASTSVVMTVFRALMAALLLVVLFTAPPRKIAVRVAMGVMGGMLLLMGLGLAAGNSMHLLDIVLFIELGLAFGLEALELNEDEIDEQITLMRRASRQLKRQHKTAV